MLRGRWVPRPTEGKVKEKEREVEREGRGREEEEGERPMGTTAYGGKGSKGRAVNGNRPVGAASWTRTTHHGVMPPPPPPCMTTYPQNSLP